MRLSIITVNYNNREGLVRTARSVVEQTFYDFEWIVVDGGSTDGSVGVIQEYADRIAWSVSEPDGGIYEAMNKGLDRASGKYVQFLNSGDSFIDYPDAVDLAYLFRNPLGHQASFIKTSVAKAHPYKVKYTISADRAFFLELYLSGSGFHHINLPVVYFDTEGIGSRESTKELRREQLYQIKRELLPPRVVDDIEYLMVKSAEFDFVKRIPPLRWVYSFFKWLKRVKSKI